MRKNIFNLLSALALVCGLMAGTGASAQTFIRYVKPEDLGTRTLYADSVLTSITLPRGVARLSTYPKFNAAALELSQVLQDPSKELLQVWVCGSASPDGLWGDNVALSQARTDAAVRYLQDIMDIPDAKIHKESLNEDWDRLAELVAASDMPLRSEVLHIIRTKTWGERKTALQKLDGGKAWKQLEKDFFPQLRCVRFAIYCKWDSSRPYLISPDKQPVSQKDTIYVRDTVYFMKETVYMEQDLLSSKESAYESYRRKSIQRERRYWDTPWMMGIKTNLLADAISVPSVGVEFQLGSNISLDLQGWYTDRNAFVKHDNLTNFYGFAPEIRWWMGDRIMRRGSFIGLHARCAWYTMQWKDGLLYQNGPENVWEGNFHNAGNDTPAWCAGITYGYSLGFGPKEHWGLEFLLGIGYANYRQNTAAYNNGTWELVEHQNRSHFGITRVGVNLTYRFSLRRVNPDYYVND